MSSRQCCVSRSPPSVGTTGLRTAQTLQGQDTGSERAIGGVGFSLDVGSQDPILAGVERRPKAGRNLTCWSFHASPLSQITARVWEVVPLILRTLQHGRPGAIRRGPGDIWIKVKWSFINNYTRIVSVTCGDPIHQPLYLGPTESC